MNTTLRTIFNACHTFGMGLMSVPECPNAGEALAAASLVAVTSASDGASLTAIAAGATAGYLAARVWTRGLKALPA